MEKKLKESQAASNPNPSSTRSRSLNITRSPKLPPLFDKDFSKSNEDPIDSKTTLKTELKDNKTTPGFAKPDVESPEFEDNNNNLEIPIVEITTKKEEEKNEDSQIGEKSMGDYADQESVKELPPLLTPATSHQEMHSVINTNSNNDQEVAKIFSESLQIDDHKSDEESSSVSLGPEIELLHDNISKMAESVSEENSSCFLESYASSVGEEVFPANYADILEAEKIKASKDTVVESCSQNSTVILSTSGSKISTAVSSGSSSGRVVPSPTSKAALCSRCKLHSNKQIEQASTIRSLQRQNRSLECIIVQKVTMFKISKKNHVLTYLTLGTIIVSR